MRIEIKVQNGNDKRKRIIKEVENRLELVELLGRPVSPKQLNDMESGRWYGLTKNQQVRVTR